MERLTFCREDRLLRAAIDQRIVQRSDLQYHRSQARPPRDHVCAAYCADLSRYGVSLIGPPIGLWRAFRVRESFCWHEHEQIRCAAREVLTRAAVALRLPRKLFPVSLHAATARFSMPPATPRVRGCR